MSKIKDLIEGLEFLLEFDYISLIDKTKNLEFIDYKKVKDLIDKYKSK